MHPRTSLRTLNLANQLTFLRLVATPFLIIAVLHGRFGLALLLFLGAAVTDLLDGLTARLFGQGTRLGAYLDPAADKLLLTAGFVVLTEYPSMLQQVEMVARIPLWLTILTISRDVMIVGIALMLHVSLGQTRFPPSIWGKWTTVGEFLTVTGFLLANWIGRRSSVLDVLVWITLALILISGLHYLQRTVRMVQRRAISERGGPRAGGSG